MKISAILKCYSTNSSLADTNLRHCQILLEILVKVARIGSQLATWQFKEGLKETEKENIWWQWKKLDKEKENSKEKRRDGTYAERRWELRKS